MTGWNPALHPREHDGQFAHGGGFAKVLSDRIGATLGEADPVGDAVREYAWGQGGSGGLVYAELNAALRGQTTLSPQAAALRGKLDQAFEQVEPITKPMVTHRMISGDRKLAQQLIRTAKGRLNRSRWTEPGYSSTTGEHDTVEDFAVGGHEVELEVHIPRGARVIDVDQHLDPNQPGVYLQHEVLLPRDSTFSFGEPVTLPNGRVKIRANLVVLPS